MTYEKVGCNGTRRAEYKERDSKGIAWPTVQWVSIRHLYHHLQLLTLTGRHRRLERLHASCMGSGSLTLLSMVGVDRLIWGRDHREEEGQKAF